MGQLPPPPPPRLVRIWPRETSNPAQWLVVDELGRRYTMRADDIHLTPGGSWAWSHQMTRAK